MLKLKVWTRADSMIEVEWDGPGFCTRYQTAKEADAFVAGFRAAHRAIRAQVAELDVDDTRPIERAPRSGA